MRSEFARKSCVEGFVAQTRHFETMSFAACCTSASSCASVMSTREASEPSSTGRPFGFVRDLDGFHRGLNQLSAIYARSSVSSLPASSIVGFAGESRTIAFGIGFFSLGSLSSFDSLGSLGCLGSLGSFDSFDSFVSVFFCEARRIGRCFEGGRNVLRISSRVHVFFSSFLAGAFFFFFFWGAFSSSSPTKSRGFGNRDAFFFFNSS